MSRVRALVPPSPSAADRDRASTVGGRMVHSMVAAAAARGDSSGRERERSRGGGEDMHASASHTHSCTCSASASAGPPPWPRKSPVRSVRTAEGEGSA